ncbi:Isoaspartyl peptidase [Oceanicaulis sp. 350]|nr:Isoaspartyl peptidase [Oceanicaulis sp. 350]
MRRLVFSVCAMVLANGAAVAQSQEQDWSIVLHGGAGVIERGDMDAETEAAYRDALDAAIRLGGEMLADGASAMDVVEAVIHTLEDDPKFNSGVGAVFTSDGRNELDASIMRGSDMQAGAVSGVTTVRHPISLARAVLENSPHVMLQSPGAEAFAADQGLELVDNSYFFTERRWASMVRAVRRMGLPVPPRPEGAPEAEPIREGALDLMEREHAFGTVGVVARDVSGEVVAGTSTGGTTAKRWGRVGDSPIIGAGTYATPDCGVSATGTGEYFIRLNVAARICTQLEMLGEEGGQQAADAVIQDALTNMGGDGGIVMLSHGEPIWSFNTAGMYRASWTPGDEPVVSIYGDEE